MPKIDKTIALLVACFCCISFNLNGQVPTYLDNSKSIDQRVEDALLRMTLEEKIAMIHAQSKFSSPGVPRLGIPENWMTDGPHGIRPEVLWDEWKQAGWTNDSCIAFPALTCLAATWSLELSQLYGKSIGEEARYRNKNVLLGPGVNIYRTPLNGRNFEYMGEDPYLASKMVVPYIKGVQSNGVAACVKHYALNNQEVDRHKVNITVDDRTLYEIYLPAFEASVKEGGAWAIMGAYNKYKGQWACHNEYLLQDILRGEWGFDGVVISDWGGVHNTDQAIKNGLDMEFGTWTDGLTMGATNAYDNYHLAESYYQKIKKGEIGTEELDEKVKNILRLSFRTTMSANRSWGSFGTPEHAQTALKIAEEGIVLLKNDNGILPIDFDATKEILVVGENAIKMMTVGGGSSSLKTKYEITPLQGFENYMGKKAKISYARGYLGDAEGSYNGVSTGQNLEETRTPEELTKEACEMANKADLVIFVGGLNKSENQDCEGHDRKNYDLPYGQNELISELAKTNSNMIVVNISGNAVAMPWVDNVPAIVQSWFNGTESGNALASILTGETNPSGKLPFTINHKLKDWGAHSFNESVYPGVNKEVEYKDGIFVGYRWNEKHNIKPLFEFGHGLSYTNFTYNKLTFVDKGDKRVVSVAIKNTGDRYGAEVVQLYVKDVKSSVERPNKELKGFEKVYLKPGESKEVTFTISDRDLSFFDAKKHDWVAEPGKFELLVGSSSTDIREKISFEFQ